MAHPRHATTIFERRSEKRLGARHSASGCGRRCAESPFGLFRSGRIGLSASGESARPLVPRQEGSIHPPLPGRTLCRPEPGRLVRPAGPDRRRRAGATAPLGPAAPYWIGLDRDTYHAQLADLRRWADTLLRRHYGGYELSDCWPRTSTPSGNYPPWPSNGTAPTWPGPGNSTTAGSPAPCAASPASPARASRTA